MNADDVLKYGHYTVLNSLDGLDHRHWETPDVCGVWSVREIIAHLASFEQVLIDVARLLLEETDATPTLDSYKSDPLRFNDVQVAQRAAMDPQAVFDEYERCQEESRALIARLPLQQRRQAGILAWYGPEYDLEDFLAYSFYGHKREHCAQINVFRDLLKKQGAAG